MVGIGLRDFLREMFFSSDNCKQAASHKRIKKVIYHETIFIFYKDFKFWLVCYFSIFLGCKNTIQVGG